MRLRTFLPVIVPMLLCGCAGAAVQAPVPAASVETRVDAAVESITAADVQRRIAFLASDALRGRDTPSPGLEAAAEYAAAELRSFGLQPAGDDGTFIQRFPFDASRLDRAAVLVEARAVTGATRLAFGTDFFVIPARLDSVVGVPLFLGPARPGVLAPADAAGRPLVFFVPDTASAAWQGAAGAALQASMAARASATVLIMPPDFAAATLGTLADQLAGQVMQVPMPVVGVRYDAAKQIFRQAGLDLDAVRTATEPATLDGVTLALR
ncbi:MAG: hypothetical protein ACREK1_10065, partial [Longimicrobiales bacterium]